MEEGSFCSVSAARRLTLKGTTCVTAVGLRLHIYFG